VTYGGTSFFSIFLLLSAFFSSFGVCAGYKVTFHDIGQGNCTVVTSPSKKVLVIDAGSSNTTGIPGVPSTGKFEHLSTRVLDSVREDLTSGNWLWFVVSHPDKDHLNLVEFMVRESGFLDLDAKEPIEGRVLGVLLGGERNIYKKADSSALVKFLAEFNIPHFFGKDAYRLQERPGFLYVPKELPSTILRDWDGTISFLSLAADAKTFKFTSKKYKKAKKDPLEEEKEDETNAASIVMKVCCGPFSVMVTGDKTKKETNFIIDRLKEEGAEKFLESELLLATHHGSATDFVPEWVALTNPRHVVISAGRSFDHPRSEAFEGYFMNASHLTPAPWHFVQFQGDFIDHGDTTRTLRSIARETPSSVEKARGYVHAITDRSVFVTASNGDIAFFSTSPGAYAINIGRKWDDQLTAVTEFFSVPQLLSGDVISMETIRLDRMITSSSLLPIFLDDKFKGLRSLSMKEADLTNDHVGVLTALITTHADLSSLHLTGNRFSSEGMDAIRTAWGYRGLTL